MWKRKMLPSNLSPLSTIKLGQCFRSVSPQGPSDIGCASAVQLFVLDTLITFLGCQRGSRSTGAICLTHRRLRASLFLAVLGALLGV